MCMVASRLKSLGVGRVGNDLDAFAGDARLPVAGRDVFGRNQQQTGQPRVASAARVQPIQFRAIEPAVAQIDLKKVLRVHLLACQDLVFLFDFAVDHAYDGGNPQGAAAVERLVRSDIREQKCQIRPVSREGGSGRTVKPTGTGTHQKTSQRWLRRAVFERRHEIDMRVRLHVTGV